MLVKKPRLREVPIISDKYESIYERPEMNQTRMVPYIEKPEDFSLLIHPMKWVPVELRAGEVVLRGSYPEGKVNCVMIEVSKLPEGLAGSEYFFDSIEQEARSVFGYNTRVYFMKK